MLIVENISKSYGEHRVLENINLEFGNGVYGLLAPNGAGKTTLIKLLTTLLFPDKGKIIYNGKDIYNMGDRYREVIGYLPQDFGYYKNYSPKKYLNYLSALNGLDKKTANKKIEKLLELVGLENVVNKKMKKFSGGMIQRVGIAQALLNNPQILILDEPTAGLDPKERARFRNLLTNLSRDRIVILSTHIVSDIESIANEIIMIKDREIVYKDSLENIRKVLIHRVYETKVPYEGVEVFREKYFSLSEKKEEKGMKIKFIAQQKEKSSWNEIEPSIEDVFLYVYKDEVI